MGYPLPLRGIMVTCFLPYRPIRRSRWL